MLKITFFDKTNYNKNKKVKKVKKVKQQRQRKQQEKHAKKYTPVSQFQRNPL